jgi:hypothetical protein
MSIETRQIQLPEKWTDLAFERRFGLQMKLDPSTYAKDRKIVWLGKEPPLSRSGSVKPGMSWPVALKERLQLIIGWEFDYCLLTYSGSERAYGIQQHRDAGSLSYEAYGLNLTGTCTFEYWEQRRGFGPGQSHGNPESGPPSHIISMTPGTLVRFNSKNPHAAYPSPNRWAMNFWKAK